MSARIAYNPLDTVIDAFNALYPAKECAVRWVPEVQGDNMGATHFADDGTVTVQIGYELPLGDAIETLGHELAHVAVGWRAGHGKRWRAALESLRLKYIELSGAPEEQEKVTP